MVTELMTGALDAIRSYDYASIVKKFPGLYARTIMKWRRTARELEKRKAKRHKIERERMKNRLLDRAKTGFTLMPFNQTAVGAEADWHVGVPRLGIGKINEDGEMVARGTAGAAEDEHE